MAVLNVKTGIGIAVLGVLGYVALKSRDSVSFGNPPGFDSSVFTDRAQSQVASIVNPIFNAGLDRKIQPIQTEISKAQTFINSQQLPKLKNQGVNPKLGRAAPCPNHNINSAAAQACRFNRAVAAAKDANRRKSIEIATNFITEQRKRVSLINSERRGL